MAYNREHAVVLLMLARGIHDLAGQHGGAPLDSDAENACMNQAPGSNRLCRQPLSQAFRQPMVPGSLLPMPAADSGAAGVTHTTDWSVNYNAGLVPFHTEAA